MAFLSLKTNTFTEMGEAWQGASERARQTAVAAAEEAASALADAVAARAPNFDRFAEVQMDKVQAVRDPSDGLFYVGMPSATDEEQRRAMEAEYGDMENSPQALMRTTQLRHAEMVAATFAESFVRRTFGESST